MAVRLTAVLKARGTGARDEAPPESRTVEVDADDYAQGKQQVLEQLPDNWVVASWRVDRSSR